MIVLILIAAAWSIVVGFVILVIEGLLAIVDACAWLARRLVREPEER